MARGYNTRRARAVGTEVRTKLRDEVSLRCEDYKKVIIMADENLAHLF